MAKTWLSRLARKRWTTLRRPDRFRPGLECLDDRIAPAVIASVPSPGQLRIVGDNGANSIVVSRTAAGVILVNGATVPAAGGVLTVTQTSLINVSGGGGNDTIVLSSANGALPGALVHGDAGNDTLIGSFGQDRLFGDVGNDILQGRENRDVLNGGLGNDTLIGGRGIDQSIGSGGADIMVWNGGDGSDTLNGGADLDTVRINGTSGRDEFSIGAAGSHAQVREAASPTLVISIGTTETLDINVLGDNDVVEINDLAGTGVATVNVDLGVAGADDGAVDFMVVNGTDTADVLQIDAVNFSSVRVSGLAAEVNVLHSENLDDLLQVNGLGEDDVLSAGDTATLVVLALDGGDGDDTINGSNGSDFLIGGDDEDSIDGNQGSDTVELGGGNDVFTWDPGDGSDDIEGGDGQDRMNFNGSAGAEVFSASANGSRLLFTRNIANIIMAVDGVEVVELNALAGADSITVNDLDATDVHTFSIFLGVNAVGDGATDSITINGTANADLIGLSGGAGNIFAQWQAVEIAIFNSEPANDSLTINGQAGADIISAQSLGNNSVRLALNGGADADVLLGSQGNDTINGDAGNDLILAGAGNDTIDGGANTDTIDGGTGTDTAVNGESVTNVP